MKLQKILTAPYRIISLFLSDLATLWKDPSQVDSDRPYFLQVRKHMIYDDPLSFSELEHHRLMTHKLKQETKTKE